MNDNMLRRRTLVRRFAPLAALLLGVQLLSVSLAVGTAGAASGPGTVTSYPCDPDKSFGPQGGVAAGPDGALWFTGTEDAIGRMTTTGQWTIFQDNSIYFPQQIVAGSDGALWFANFGGSASQGSIGRITTTGVVTNYTDPTVYAPFAMAAGSDGAVWFINYARTQAEMSIGRITSAGVVTNYTDPSINGPQGIAAGSDGAMWFTNYGSNSIGRISASGTVTNYTTSDPNIVGPANIASGPDGAIWFTNAGSNAIGRITTSGVITSYAVPGSAGAGIAAGPDGALWFTGGTSLGRITTSGSVTSYPGVSAMGGIVAGPDGAMWFLSSSSCVGRITTTKSFPTSPRGVNAGPGNGTATVRWSSPVAEGGSAVVSYVVTPYVGISPQSSRTFNSNATTEVVTGLTNGTTYTFEVNAVNALGSSPPSPASGPIVVGAPIAPFIAPVAAPGNTRATLTWTAASSNNGSAINDYVVTRLISGVSHGTTTFNATARTGTIGGLTSGDIYTFKVAARNARGIGTNSPASTPIVIGSPAAPTAVSASPRSAGAVVKWTASASNNGSAITAYVITPYLGTTAQSSTTVAPPATTATVTGLTNANIYAFKVAAKNARGTSPSGTSSAVTVGAPSEPTNVNATAHVASATVSWAAPASNGSAVTAYIITPYLAGVAQPARTFNSTATTETVSGLSSGKTYTFTVNAKNANGTGPQSIASNAVTPT